MIREEMLRRLEALVEYAIGGMEDEYQPYDTRKGWAVLRSDFYNERCGNCEYWTLAICVSDKHINPGVCRGWITGMFSCDSCDPKNEQVFKTYEDFYCSCFKPRSTTAQKPKP